MLGGFIALHLRWFFWKVVVPFVMVLFLAYARKFAEVREFSFPITLCADFLVSLGQQSMLHILICIAILFLCGKGREVGGLGGRWWMS